MTMKTCRVCKLELPLVRFYTDPSYPDGHKATCRQCHNKRDNESKRRRKLERDLRREPEVAVRLQSNQLALELLALAFSKDPAKPLYARIQIEGAYFPMEQGLEVLSTSAGPVVVFQTPTSRIRKSLTVEPLAHIAAEMDNHKVQILFDGIPLPQGNHRLTRALKTLARVAGNNLNKQSGIGG